MSKERESITERLARQVVIFDGAMGTELYRRNVFVNTSYEGLNLSAPATVADIHRSYAEAGAEVINTNTFGANSNCLSKYGLASKVREINAAGVKLARENAGKDSIIAGSVGPVGPLPVGSDLTEEQLVAILFEQIAAIEEAGADFLMMETISTRADASRAIQAAARSKLPYIISLSVDRNGESNHGEPLAAFIALIDKAPRPPAAVGLNCGEGPESALGATEKIVALTQLPVVVRPNAGVPKPVEGRMLYMTSPEYFTTYALRMVNLGIRGIGGCCGTTPDHIRDLARSIRPLAGGQAARAIAKSVQLTETPLKDAVPLENRSSLGAKLASRKWITTVEIVPPQGYDLKKVLEKAVQCREAGVDAINIPDGPRASSRLSPLVTAHEIQEKAGIEAILHFCCRDKNLIGMQADLFGCAAIGIRNILFVTGDPPKLGDYPFASAVFDADSIGMARIQSRLNRGVDLGGKSVDPVTQAVIGVGADPNAIDMKRELRRTREKVAAGAEFIITQPVFAVEPLLRFLDAIADLRIPLIAGVWPLASYRNAEFMKHEVPGVVVPDSIMERMAKPKTREGQLQEGIAIARESVDAIRCRIAGIQVSAPFGNVSTAIAVLKHA